jgi:YggT family protein
VEIDDMTAILISAVGLFYKLLVYLILGRAVLSWFVRNPYDTVGKIYNVIIQITEPILAPCRKLLSRFGLMGMIDLSPILALIALSVIYRILLSVLWTLRV